MKLKNNKKHPVTHVSAENKTKINNSKIGYYGKPITELSRDELLVALAELVELYQESQRKNRKCREVLGKEKFDSL